MPATVAPQSLKVHKTTGADVYKTRSMSVRRAVQAGITTISDVVSSIAVRSSSTEQAAIRPNSSAELEVQFGKLSRKLRDKSRREMKRGQVTEIGKKQQRRAKVLCRGAHPNSRSTC